MVAPLIVGPVPNTKAPDPVSSPTVAARFALVAFDKNVAMFVASPLTPVVIGSAVPLVRLTADGVPRFGVTSTGELAKTLTPVPVLSLSAPSRFALENVPSSVAPPDGGPATPVAIGRPVQLPRLPEAGMPRFGAISVGPLANTNWPDPVSSEMVLLSCSDVGAANRLSGLDFSASPPPPNDGICEMGILPLLSSVATPLATPIEDVGMIVAMAAYTSVNIALMAVRIVP